MTISDRLMDKIPECCGKSMRVNIETTRFIEVQCPECGDVIYIKKDSSEGKPVMLDD
jgi:predicted RNA-binding Zn-ribbon protein involved in translation (DUF1610 family)